MSLSALAKIDNILYCLRDTITDQKVNATKPNLPRQSFPNTSLSFQCRKYTSLFNHIRGNLDYQNFQYLATCLRVKYPVKTVKYFIDNFGMYLLSKKEFTKLGVTWYFLISPKSDNDRNNLPPTSSKEAEELLWKYNGGVLQLRYDHGNDKNDAFKINNGNVKPYRGFGHIAFNTDDVYAACTVLEKNGVTFKKKPNEGRMKGLAFAYDPNGYWIEIVKRDPDANLQCKYNLSQTMIRIKNPEKSLKFYCDLLGMRLVNERHFPKNKFSLYFLSSFIDDVPNIKYMTNEQRYKLMKKQFHPIIELTHNWGTEADDQFEYHNGNDECPLGVGFVHISFLVNNLKESLKVLKDNNAPFKDLPKYLQHKRGTTGFTFLEDPDEYTIEILQRGESPVNPYKADDNKDDNDDKSDDDVDDNMIFNNRLTVNGMDELNTELNKIKNDDNQNKKRIFLLFCAGIDKNKGISWCPDCVSAKPIIDDNIHVLNNDADIFITVKVGERDYWKKQDNAFRTDSRFKLTSIPTLIKYNTQQKLVEGECKNTKLVKAIFEEDDD